jgi:hypothetical protein
MRLPNSSGSEWSSDESEQGSEEDMNPRDKTIALTAKDFLRDPATGPLQQQRCGKLLHKRKNSATAAAARATLAEVKHAQAQTT